MRATLVLGLVVLVSVMLASVILVYRLHGTPQDFSEGEPLPKIAPAPLFTLTSQDGAPISLADLRGKVVAVTFIFTLCTATCPVLTTMMSLVQDRLGSDFGSKVVFVNAIAANHPLGDFIAALPGLTGLTSVSLTAKRRQGVAILLANRVAQVHAPSEPISNKRKHPRSALHPRNQRSGPPNPLTPLTSLAQKLLLSTGNHASWVSGQKNFAMVSWSKECGAYLCLLAGCRLQQRFRSIPRLID